MFQNGDLLVFAIALHFGRSQECNSVGDIMYKELNCVPSSYDEVTHCPSSYQCNFYQLVDFCRNPGTTTVQHTVGHCSDCFCDASSGKISCKERECVEWTNFEHTPTYYYKYALNQCCGVEKVYYFKPVCRVNGIEYLEGQIIFSFEKCASCICQNDDKVCQPFDCGVRTKFRELRKFCAPVYFSLENACCPDSWKCLEYSDNLPQLRQLSPNRNPTLSCKYGTYSLNLGEGFYSVLRVGKSDQRNVVCECILPPLLTCKFSHESAAVRYPNDNDRDEY